MTNPGIWFIGPAEKYFFNASANDNQLNTSYLIESS